MRKFSLFRNVIRGCRSRSDSDLSRVSSNLPRLARGSPDISPARFRERTGSVSFPFSYSGHETADCGRSPTRLLLVSVVFSLLLYTLVELLVNRSNQSSNSLDRPHQLEKPVGATSRLILRVYLACSGCPPDTPFLFPLKRSLLKKNRIWRAFFQKHHHPWCSATTRPLYEESHQPTDFFRFS